MSQNLRCTAIALQWQRVPLKTFSQHRLQLTTVGSWWNHLSIWTVILDPKQYFSAASSKISQWFFKSAKTCQNLTSLTRKFIATSDNFHFLTDKDSIDFLYISEKFSEQLRTWWVNSWLSGDTFLQFSEEIFINQFLFLKLTKHKLLEWAQHWYRHCLEDFVFTVFIFIIWITKITKLKIQEKYNLIHWKVRWYTS